MRFDTAVLLGECIEYLGYAVAYVITIMIIAISTLLNRVTEDREPKGGAVR